MKKIVLCLLVLSFILSCAKLPSREDENWYLWMVDLVKSYTFTYFEPPDSVDDLIHYLELENGFLSENTFVPQYDFLKKHRDKIIIFTDCDITFMYFKNTKLKNGVIGTSIETYCSNERGMQETKIFFNQDGDPVLETPRTNLDRMLRIRLRTLNYKLPNVQWQREEGRDFPDVIIIEFTPEQGLINICSKTEIDISSNHYYKQLYDCLKEFAEDNNLSKIILDSYIPTE